MWTVYYMEVGRVDRMLILVGTCIQDVFRGRVCEKDVCYMKVEFVRIVLYGDIFCVEEVK